MKSQAKKRLPRFTVCVFAKEGQREYWFDDYVEARVQFGVSVALTWNVEVWMLDRGQRIHRFLIASGVKQ